METRSGSFGVISSDGQGIEATIATCTSDNGNAVKGVMDGKGGCDPDGVCEEADIEMQSRKAAASSTASRVAAFSRLTTSISA